MPSETDCFRLVLQVIFGNGRGQVGDRSLDVPCSWWGQAYRVGKGVRRSLSDEIVQLSS
ncbi:hypothetical protein [Merismopedia glauca]|uniref:hypothetical protein n=1 Tax=Merismopedia glauca TaxID=292586 RepID=UPI0015E6C1AB|nr:hypothetical protein [Merismopedia glauca]